jgi:hypothetical protein
LLCLTPVIVTSFVTSLLLVCYWSVTGSSPIRSLMVGLLPKS